MDPIDLGRAGLLPRVWIVERVAPGEFRFRLAGEHVNKVFRGSIAGLTLSDLFDGETAAHIGSRWDRVLDEHLLSHSRGTIRTNGNIHHVGERLSLPLAATDGSSRFLIGGNDQRAEDRFLANPIVVPSYAPEVERFLRLEDVEALVATGPGQAACSQCPFG